MKLKTYTLQEIATIKYGKNQKKVLSDNGTVPIYGTGGLMGYAIQALYDKPSVLIGRKGTIDKVHYVTQPFWTVDTLFYTEINNSIVLPHYLYYAFSVLDLKQYNEGTSIPSLRSATLNRMEFKLPEISVQIKILDVLEAIDNKIELNNKINNNLEQQMKHIFLNNLSKTKASNIVTVGDVIFSANTGADAIRKAPIVNYNTGIRCVRVGDMTNRRSYYDWAYAKVTEEDFKRYRLYKDDIVVTRTASLGLNTIIFDDLQAVYNNGLIRLSVNKKKIFPLFLYRQFQTDDFLNYIARIESETSVRPNMKINYLLKYSFILPSIAEQEKLIQLFAPMIKQQNTLIVENKQLAEIRDTILPKLLSGEIDVSE